MSGHIDVFNKAVSLDTAPAFAPITGIRLWYDDEHAFFSGDETGRVLEADCPWATQAIADNVLSSVRDFVYQPFTAQTSLLDPVAELGDSVEVGGVWSILASVDTTFDAMYSSDIAAPADEEIDHEYPYLTKQQREMNRKVTLGADYYGTRITRQHGIEVVTTKADGTETARVVLNSDVMAFYDENGDEALYFDAESGKYRFVGDVNITGGTLNINDNFIVDEDGNLTINGNINLSDGNITWGDNDPSTDVGSVLDRRYGITYTKIGKSEIESPLIRGDEIQVTGSFQCLDDDGDVKGYMGTAYGRNSDGNPTYGVALARDYSSASGLGSNYVIVTDGGVRMQCGSNSITVTDTGAYFNGKYIATVE